MRLFDNPRRDRNDAFHAWHREIDERQIELVVRTKCCLQRFGVPGLDEGNLRSNLRERPNAADRELAIHLARRAIALAPGREKFAY